MRRFLVLPLIATALCATPALAQHRPLPHRAPDLDQAARMLSNPAVQDGLAEMIGQFADAFLDTRVGPVAVLTNPRDDVQANDTLGDLVRRDDPAFDARLQDNARRSLAVTGHALLGAGAMTRELQATAERLRRVLDQYRRY